MRIGGGGLLVVVADLSNVGQGVFFDGTSVALWIQLSRLRCNHLPPCRHRVAKMGNADPDCRARLGVRLAVAAKDYQRDEEFFGKGAPGEAESCTAASRRSRSRYRKR